MRQRWTTFIKSVGNMYATASSSSSTASLLYNNVGDMRQIKIDQLGAMWIIGVTKDGGNVCQRNI